MTEKSGADILIETLCDLGVEVVFGYPGGAVLPIYDAIFKQDRIKHILVRHEQAATHAAEGYARATGKPGVVLVTSGPGATNAVTGITDALMDSIPMVVITGQVPTGLIGTDAFQEADTVGITRHCSKHNYLVKDPARLEPTIREAFYIATSGRPGPVVIDIPKDVQVATARRGENAPISHKTYRPQVEPDAAAIEKAVDMLAAAERPIFYTGGGVINSGPEAARLLRQLAEITGAPVTSTLMGLGAFPASDEKWLGMLGMHGTYEANMAMNKADLIIALGARFDDRVTGRLDAFSPNSAKIHVDIDRSSINKNVRVDLPIVADVGRALQAMIDAYQLRKHPRPDLTEWWNRIQGWRQTRCLDFQEADPQVIMPQRAIKALWEATRDKAPIITTEVGQHQMWAAQHFDFEDPNKWLTSGGLGTMGYGLPAAIGAQLGNPDALVIDIAGEASIQMNIQELATATQYRLPVKIFILNNEYMGMVRQWQQLTYQSRYSESYSDALPDFVKLAEAYGWKGIRIEMRDQLDTGIAEMLAHDGPVLVDCMVAKLANCFPMIPSGAAHTEMLLQSAEVSGEMDDEAKALVWSHAYQGRSSRAAHARRHRRQRAGHPRPDRRPVHGAGLQHLLAYRVGDQRRRPDQPHHHRHRGVGPGDGADHRPARTAGAGAQGDRPHCLRPACRARAGAGEGGGHRRAPDRGAAPGRSLSRPGGRRDDRELRLRSHRRIGEAGQVRRADARSRPGRGGAHRDRRDRERGRGGMIARGLVAIGLLAVSNGVNAQTAPPAGTPGFEDMLAGQSVLKMNGACNRLTTPEGDRTPECDKQLINIAFASGNSTFLATMEGKGSISFRGRDSAARGDVATIALRSVILTGTDLSSPPVEIKAKGQCTYTNPHKGPIQVECSANTAKGKYELSYVSDGVWPPK